jgi:hypothetical protein
MYGVFADTVTTNVPMSSIATIVFLIMSSSLERGLARQFGLRLDLSTVVRKIKIPGSAIRSYSGS